MRQACRCAQLPPSPAAVAAGGWQAGCCPWDPAAAAAGWLLSILPSAFGPQLQLRGCYFNNPLSMQEFDLSESDLEGQQLQLK